MRAYILLVLLALAITEAAKLVPKELEFRVLEKDREGQQGLIKITREQDQEDEENQARPGGGATLSRRNDEPDPFDDDFCYDPSYRKTTLKLIKESPFIGLFGDLKNQTRFEASGVCFAKGFYWVVFDSLRSIGRIDLHFSFMAEENVLVGEVGDESQFEGMTYIPSKDSFLVVRETFNHDIQGLVSQTEELKMSKDLTDYRVVEKCIIDFQLEDVNKGFESLYFYEDKTGRYIMALCESNFCKTIVGDDPPGLDRGHGRLVIAKYHPAVKGVSECAWNVTKVVEVPHRAFFLDYSGIAFHGYMGSRVAVISQEDAAVWVGEFDWTELEFVGKGKVFHFPRDEHCGKVYCNVEGIQFIDRERIVLTSDKSKATQVHSCMHKDQSVHVMALPR